ncbi:MAG: GGDEF domain-containing protein [Woeseiaceae bacterium]|nr:GGDEF domain-containing protein [Woeseiaceae bacterium]
MLVQITEILRLRIRVTDSLYRIGGEEFVIVLEGQSIDRASKLAEPAIAPFVEANELIPNRDVTISLGVAELKSAESLDDWLRRADDALYAAKRAGRGTATRVDAAIASSSVRPLAS